MGNAIEPQGLPLLILFIVTICLLNCQLWHHAWAHPDSSFYFTLIFVHGNFQNSKEFSRLVFICHSKCSLFLNQHNLQNNLVYFAGPISGPSEAEFILKSTKGVHGFYGASSMERLPVEQAITSTVQQYKLISIE